MPEQRRDDGIEPRLHRSKAIRAKCIDCCGGQPGEVRLCTAFKCPLWEWRFGRPLREDDPGVEEWVDANRE